MSDKKISDLVEVTSLAADDVLPVVDASANATKRVTYDTLATEVRTESEPLSATTVTASGDITSNGETVYHRGNVVGTVSQSGGTPTGAVVERDSNANGEYTKFADGTMICQQTFTGVDLTTTSDVTNILYGEVTWNFPVDFAAIPLVYGHRQGGNGMGSGSFVQTDDVGLRFWINESGGRTNQTGFAVAIGRWY